MTESEWPASSDPAAMLDHLRCFPTGDASGGREYHPHLPSDRKLRLFACACWRLQDGLSRPLRQAVERSEAVADGGNPPHQRDGGYVVDSDTAIDSATLTLGWMGMKGMPSKASCAALLREIVGNPWRPVKRLWLQNSEWYVWHQGGGPRRVDMVEPPRNTPNSRWLTPTVVALAESAYAERNDDGTLDNDRLAVLSDALEEAGCSSDDLLGHLRGLMPCPRGCGRGKFGKPCGLCGDTYWVPCGPHARGCWALDLILGKS